MMKDGSAISPNVCTVTFGPPCSLSRPYSHKYSCLWLRAAQPPAPPPSLMYMLLSQLPPFISYLLSWWHSPPGGTLLSVHDAITITAGALSQFTLPLTLAMETFQLIQDQVYRMHHLNLAQLEGHIRELIISRGTEYR